VTASEANAYRSKFNTLRGAHRRLAVEVGYPAKIEMLRGASLANSRVTRAIYDLARAEFPDINISRTSARDRGMKQDIGRVRESLKHLVRDWGSEGARERETIFAPILTELKKIPAERRSRHRVLVPGAGLGRLAWEIANMGQWSQTVISFHSFLELGFDTTSCELSYYMNLSLRFLLSPQTTTTPDQHTVHPYVHWWSHQRSNHNTFRGISIPDVLPRRMPNWTVLEEDFLGLSHPRPVPSNGIVEPQGGPNENKGYDTIVTLYFIDTASNIISYVSLSLPRPPIRISFS
jgi:carnosine N-methyltransferase